MYRINWKSNRTGRIGHGEPIFSTYEEATKIVQYHNREHEKYPGDLLGGLLHHWVEFISDENEQKKNADET